MCSLQKGKEKKRREKKKECFTTNHRLLFATKLADACFPSRSSKELMYDGVVDNYDRIAVPLSDDIR